jgi:hypothetical protein
MVVASILVGVLLFDSSSTTKTTTQAFSIIPQQQQQQKQKHIHQNQHQRRQQSSLSIPSSSSSSTPSSTTALFDGDGTGGWGIGGQREITPEEFVRGGGDRSYFDGYKMSEQGDFISQISAEKDALKRSELEELLGVARIAGLNVKNPKDRLNKFEDNILGDEDDDLDLAV